MARSAVARSQPWFASTRSETSGPTASRRGRTRATSCACVTRGVRRRLDLEDAMAERDRGARLGHLRLRALDGERPGERHAVADAAAEQAVHGHAERLAAEVPQRPLGCGA